MKITDKNGMKKANYTRKETKWRIYHNLEKAEKERRFKKMPETEGFETLKAMHSFAYKTAVRKCPARMDRDKIQTLFRIHSTYGNIKP